MCVPMEHVEYEPEHNPEAITKYYSCDLQTGKSKNPEIKFMILKAKNHLSAIGWSFYYTFKKSGRRELRYRSPAGKTYCSLRTACHDLLVHQDHHAGHDLDLESSKIEITEQETKDEIVGRPKKRIRIEDVENSYFHQKTEPVENGNDLGVAEDEKKEGFPMDHRPRKSLCKIKKVKKSRGKRNGKRIRKVEASSSSCFTGRRCVLSLLIQRQIVLPGSRVVYRNRKDYRIMARGRVYDEGIQCDCCALFFLLSKFEVHAGSTYRRPAANIFLDDGRSLFDCQTQLNNQKQVYKAIESSGHDEFCSFCNDGGELLLCDSCTSSFHSSCIGLKGLPDSDHWFCPSCCCGICLQGQIIEDSHDHGQIKCQQCEQHFHIDCLRKDSDALKSFCSKKCERIFSGLMGISGKSIMLPMENLRWSLLKHENNINETYMKLKEALDVMHECFEPVQHPRSNNDVVEDVMFSRSSFKGFFTAVLEKDEEVVTVVTIRVHGCKVAEIPFVATRFEYRRLGMCRILMEEVERRLGELGVERLVLPAVPETVSTWTQAFGFNTMTDAERLSHVKCKFLDFPGTIKCQKILKNM